MKKHILVVTFALALLGGCASSHPPLQETGPADSVIAPRQAVFMAADAAPEPVEGIFAMEVQATGVRSGQTYLNSERDYRDQRNLTIAITPRATQQLAQRLDADPREALKGKGILLRGAAVRTKIHFFANGRMTDKYYYQTHVNVTDAEQITVR